MTFEIVKDRYGQEIIFIINEDNTTVSMPKAIWDEQQKAAELGGTL